jgi:hypothetical protein
MADEWKTGQTITPYQGSQTATPQSNASGLDAATIGAIQNYLKLPATMVWDAATAAAFTAFQTAKGWGLNYGLTGNADEWEKLTHALSTGDRSLAPKPAAPTPTQPAGPTSDQKSARAFINDQLRSWGLESLGDWAWQQILDGNTELLPTLIRNTSEYKARFSGLEARRAAGLNVMSESQYLQLENDYRSIMHSYGIPQGVFDTQSFLGNLIAKDLSPAELNDRLRIYQDAAYNAPQELRDSLSRIYGIDQGGLTAYFINPDMALPALEKQYAAAGAASAAQRAGFAMFGQGTAERLAELGAKTTDVGVFQNLGKATELFTGLGVTSDSLELSRDQAALGAFGGDQQAADAMERRARERVAEFGGSKGGFAGDQRGISGLGSAGN